MPAAPAPGASPRASCRGPLPKTRAGGRPRGAEAMNERGPSVEAGLAAGPGKLPASEGCAEIIPATCQGPDPARRAGGTRGRGAAPAGGGRAGAAGGYPGLSVGRREPGGAEAPSTGVEMETSFFQSLIARQPCEAMSYKVQRPLPTALGAPVPGMRGPTWVPRGVPGEPRPRCLPCSAPNPPCCPQVGVPAGPNPPLAGAGGASASAPPRYTRPSTGTALPRGAGSLRAKALQATPMPPRIPPGPAGAEGVTHRGTPNL